MLGFEVRIFFVVWNFKGFLSDFRVLDANSMTGISVRTLLMLA